LGKYIKEVRAVRTISRKQIIPYLKEKPATAQAISKYIQSKNKKLCDDSIKCICGKKSSTMPEWKHQIKWAIQDLKYHGEIDYDKDSGKYSIK